jgi:hypothetical protein
LQQKGSSVNTRQLWSWEIRTWFYNIMWLNLLIVRYFDNLLSVSASKMLGHSSKMRWENFIYLIALKVRKSSTNWQLSRGDTSWLILSMYPIRLKVYPIVLRYLWLTDWWMVLSFKISCCLTDWMQGCFSVLQWWFHLQTKVLSLYVDN